MSLVYPTLLSLIPVLAISLTAYVMNTAVVQKLISIQPFGAAIYFAGKLVSYIFVCAAFTFIYIFIPNTNVKFTSALVGGVFAGVLWQTIGWGFASFIASSEKCAAIYSGLP